MQKKLERNRRPTSQLAQAAANATSPRQQAHLRHQLAAMQPRAAPVKQRQTWELGQPITDQDQLALARNLLKRIKRAAKSLSTPESVLENQKCRALAELSIQTYKETSR